MIILVYRNVLVNARYLLLMRRMRRIATIATIVTPHDNAFQDKEQIILASNILLSHATSFRWSLLRSAITVSSAVKLSQVRVKHTLARKF